DLIETGGINRHHVIERTIGNNCVRIEIWPDYELPGDLTSCERDLIRLLARQSQRLTVQAILSEMDRLAYQGQVDLYGESTIRRALSRLVHKEILTNSRRSPAGYAVAKRYRSAQVEAC